jgi:Ankyrin repeats (3 copies)
MIPQQWHTRRRSSNKPDDFLPLQPRLHSSFNSRTKRSDSWIKATTATTTAATTTTTITNQNNEPEEASNNSSLNSSFRLELEPDEDSSINHEISQTSLLGDADDVRLGSVPSQKAEEGKTKSKTKTKEVLRKAALVSSQEKESDERMTAKFHQSVPSLSSRPDEYLPMIKKMAAPPTFKKATSTRETYSSSRPVDFLPSQQHMTYRPKLVSKKSDNSWLNKKADRDKEDEEEEERLHQSVPDFGPSAGSDLVTVIHSPEPQKGNAPSTAQSAKRTKETLNKSTSAISTRPDEFLPLCKKPSSSSPFIKRATVPPQQSDSSLSLRPDEFLPSQSKLGTYAAKTITKKNDDSWRNQNDDKEDDLYKSVFSEPGPHEDEADAGAEMLHQSSTSLRPSGFFGMTNRDNDGDVSDDGSLDLVDDDQDEVVKEVERLYQSVPVLQTNTRRDQSPKPKISNPKWTMSYRSITPSSSSSSLIPEECLPSQQNRMFRVTKKTKKRSDDSWRKVNGNDDKVEPDLLFLHQSVPVFSTRHDDFDTNNGSDLQDKGDFNKSVSHISSCDRTDGFLAVKEPDGDFSESTTNHISSSRSTGFFPVPSEDLHRSEPSLGTAKLLAPKINSTKKSPRPNDLDPPNPKFLKFLDLDPRRDERVEEKVFMRMIHFNPSLLQRKYRFEAFPGELLYPLHMLCALRASVSCVKACYKLFTAAIEDMESSNLGSPLHFSCAFAGNDSVDVVRYLAKKRPEALLLQNKDGYTPLHLAVHSTSCEDVVSLLTAKEPAATAQVDHLGRTPLHIACSEVEEPSLAIVQDLTEVYATVATVKAADGSWPLWSVLGYKPERVEEIVKDLIVSNPEGASIRHDVSNEMPLHKALKNNHELIVVRDIVRANPEALLLFDRDGNLPLHIAVECHYNLAMIKMLVNKGPGAVEKKNNRGEIAHELAKRLYGYNCVIEFLYPYEQV